MDDVSLLFDRMHAFLGEVATSSGAMRRIVLTAEGERILEAHLKEWQARGVPVLRSVAGHRAAFFQERVQVRDPGFLPAMRQWVENHGMALITVRPDVFGCWESIVRLPLDAKEKFLLLVSLRGSSPADLKDCRAALRDAIGAADAEREKAEKAVGQLWDRAAKQLVAQFAG